MQFIVYAILLVSFLACKFFPGELTWYCEAPTAKVLGALLQILRNLSGDLGQEVDALKKGGL